MNRIKDVFDGDTCRVLIASALPAGLTLADASAITAIAAGLVSIAYTVKKWRDSNRKNRKEDITDSKTLNHEHHHHI